jgi:hypothetical protein
MYQMTHRIRYLVFLLLLAFSAVVVGEATNRDIVLVLDKGTDLRSIKNEIGTIFEKLNTAENNARIAVIGFDAVVTDIASLSLASEGGGKVLLDALTNEEAISSSANVAAGVERSISELTSQEAVDGSKTMIIFSDGNIQTGSEESNQDYRSWLVDVLTQSAIHSKIRIFWVSIENNTSRPFIQQVAESTGGKHYLIDKAAEGELVKDVLLMAATQPSNETQVESSTAEEVSVAEISEPLEDAPKPEPESRDVEATLETLPSDIAPAKQTETNAEVLEVATDEPKEKVSITERLSESFSYDFTSLSISIKERLTYFVNRSRELISTQNDKQTWVLALLGFLVLMIIAVLVARASRNKVVARVEPVIIDKTNQMADPPMAATEDLFVDAVMQKSELSKEDSMNSNFSATRKDQSKASFQEERQAGLNQPSVEGVKVRDRSPSNDRTVIRPASK